MKDFDGWNKSKKIIDSGFTRKLYHEREVWWCLLGTNIGFEQDGTGDQGERPVLILKGFSSQVCLVVPLTSSKKNNLYHFYLGEISKRDAFGIISQLRLIDTKRLVNKIAVIDKGLFSLIRKAVRDLF